VLSGLPHPDTDVTGRWSYSLLKGLSERKFSVRCLAVSTRPELNADTAALLKHHNVDASFFAPTRSSSWVQRKLSTVREPYSYLLPDELRRAVDVEAQRGYDVLHLEPLWTGYLAGGRGRTLTSVLNMHSVDLENVWQFSPRFLWSKYALRHAERRLLGSLTQVRTLTPRLEQAVRALNPSIAAHTVPLSIDAERYDFQSADRHDAPVLGFVGTMNWSPGYLAARRLLTRIFPAVRARRSDARLLLAGWNAEESLREYARVPGVEIVSNVPDVRPYFERLQILTYPLPRGTGMMVKILEAFAYGIPVVTTSEGIEGIDAEDGVHALLADDDETIVENVLRLLDDVALRKRLRVNARRLLEERYSPAASAAALERVYRQLT
jgi:glycosyltransferase involved in cell wall biosynthesis